MSIHVIIPVHNRLDHTKMCLTDLMSQDSDLISEIIVVDDGSYDGTAEYLLDLSNQYHDRQPHITIIRGDGSWWWTKSVEVAMRYLSSIISSEELVLLLNNDVRLPSDYISQLLKVRDAKGDCIVMSQLVDIDDRSHKIPSPIRVDPVHLGIGSIATETSDDNVFLESHLAPGRGTLYPGKPIQEGHFVDSRNLPHYIADYEYSARISKMGYPIFCASRAEVFTEINWGNSRRYGNIFNRLTAKESPENIGAYWAFWRTWEPSMSRFVLAWKIVRYKLLPAILRLEHK